MPRGEPQRKPSLRGRKERNALVEANLRLVPWTVTRYAPTSDEETFQDRVQSGMIGLIRAAELFDETKGFTFSTYAVRWIRQAIQRDGQVGATARTIHIPEGVRLRAVQTGTLDDLPAVTTSLDQPMHDDESGEFGDFIPAPVDDAAERRELLREVVEMLDRLPDMERRAVLARHREWGHTGNRRQRITPWGVVRQELGVDSTAMAKALYERAIAQLRRMAAEAA